MSHDPTPRDLELADAVVDQLRGAPLDLTLRAAAQMQMAAYERARRGTAPSRFYQVAPGLTIDRDGEPFWGAHFCDGRYLRDMDLCRRAQRNSIENDHAEGLRRNDWLDRQRVRFAVTDAGRAALAEPNGAERRIA